MLKKEVVEKIGEENWEKFQRFMFCQTVGITKDGEEDYYETDVDRFIRQIKNI